MSNLVHSDHAQIRSKQRGISWEKIDLAIANVTPKQHKGDYLYYVRKEDVQRMVTKGVVPIQMVDKLRNLVVVYDPNQKEVVTTYFATQQKQKRILKYY